MDESSPLQEDETDSPGKSMQDSFVQSPIQPMQESPTHQTTPIKPMQNDRTVPLEEASIPSPSPTLSVETVPIQSILASTILPVENVPQSNLSASVENNINVSTPPKPEVHEHETSLSRCEPKQDVQELQTFLAWCQEQLQTLTYNQDVFTVLSCMVAMRMRYMTLEQLDATPEIKQNMTHELYKCFMMFYSLLCILCSVWKNCTLLPAAGLSMESYDVMFQNHVLCSCVQEMASMSMIAYYHKNHTVSKGRRQKMCHEARSWWHCLHNHVKCILHNHVKSIQPEQPTTKKGILAAKRQLVPYKKLMQETFYCNMPAHHPSKKVASMGETHAIWIQILMTALNALILQLDANSDLN